MRTSLCPKCGASYELHPLNPKSQELCPACRNEASWGDIRRELAKAAVQSGASKSGAHMAHGPATLVPREPARAAGAFRAASAGRSVFSPREGAAVLVARHNPFGANTAEVALARRPILGSSLDRPHSLGRVELNARPVAVPLQTSKAMPGSETALTMDKVAPQLRDVPVAAISAPAVAPVAEVAPQLAPLNFALPVLGAQGFDAVAPVPAPSGFGLAAAQPALGGMGFALGLPADKPGMIEMPNTCGG